MKQEGVPQWPVFSIIIPAYNCEKTIASAVRSARSQTVKGIEILVIDDASVDRTFTRAEEASEGDPRVRLLKNESNAGVAQTRNRGIRAARGEYVAFLDSDDLWTRDKLAWQYSALSKSGADICCTGYELITADGYTTGKVFTPPERITYREMLKANLIGLSTSAVRAETLAGWQMDGRFAHEDYELWLRLLRAGKRAVGVQRTLTYYRPGGRSRNKFKAAAGRWAVYRSQGIGVLPSCFYMGAYALNALTKFSNSQNEGEE